MRIGILTFHNAENYGAVLQAYALREHLRRERPADTIEIVGYENPSIGLSYRYFKPWSYFEHRGVRRLASFLLQLYYLPQRARVRRAFREFAGGFLEPGDAGLDAYDCVVYGSDQIWNPSLTGNDAAYLGAGFSGRKVAYAASDGGELVLDGEVVRLLEGFRAISCRERTLAARLGQHLPEKSVETVCDPVFLLSREDWLSFAQPPKERGYVLVYRVAESGDLDREAESFGKRHGRRVVQVVYARSVRRLFRLGQRFVSAITPNEFVGYFAHADLVLTTSFHGTAFSVILGRDFYTLRFAHRSGRVIDLLGELGLSGRFVAQVPALEDIGCHGIDWEEVSRRLGRYRRDSADFLSRSLRDASAED